MSQFSVLHSLRFKGECFSVLQACHTSWVNSNLTGGMKDWGSGANCHCTLQESVHAPLILQCVCEKDLCPVRYSKGFHSSIYKQSSMLLQWSTAFSIVFKFLNTLKFFQARELSRNFVLVCVAVQAPAPAQAQAIYTEFKSIFQPRMEQGDSMKCRNAAPICLKDYITCNVSFCCFSSP